MNQREIDEAAFNAWPSIRQILYDGWILRFSRGYTKRANAVYPLFSSTYAPIKKIDRCEGIYDHRNMPTIFRLTPKTTPADLDRILADRGYHTAEPSLVMDRPLSPDDFSDPPSPAFAILPPDPWHRSFEKTTGMPPERARIHKEIISLIPGDVLFSAIVEDEEVLAVGLGVMDAGFFGMFDLVTRAEFRQHGYGTTLVREMLRWAAGHHARRAYLQVVGTNETAQRIYKRIGFQNSFDYWYRARESGK